MNKIHTVGIIGGGVSGSVTALQLANNGIRSVLFEQESSLVNGPPFCHLHAGGNLYPEICDEQCKKLMKQSIEMARLFPESIDKRPTLIAVPKTEKYELANIKMRLHMLVDYYQSLIDQNPSNEILGNPSNYYQLYQQDDLERLVKKPTTKNPVTSTQWVTNAIQLIDYKKLKMPIILVQEYGWNLFRLGAQAQRALLQTQYCQLHLNTHVNNIKDVRDKGLAHNWEIQANEQVYKVKYLINSCGFKTGIIDDALNIKTQRSIEFKAAYIAQWQPLEGSIPELIFHGERGTPNGMAQLTPYCDDYYQIHGMTEDITLFKNGLVDSNSAENQPRFTGDIENKLIHGWTNEEIIDRTTKSIDLVAKFIPSFHSAVVAGKPLFGAQQIPGDDPTLRVGEVSFLTKNYARSEIVKASSALAVSVQIINKMQEEQIIPVMDRKLYVNHLLDNIPNTDIDKIAEGFTIERGYPRALSRLLVK